MGFTPCGGSNPPARTTTTADQSSATSELRPAGGGIGRPLRHPHLQSCDGHPRRLLPTSPPRNGAQFGPRNGAQLGMITRGITAAAAVGILTAACGGESSRDGPSPDAAEPADAGMSLAEQACDAFQAVFEGAHPSDQQQAVRYADAAADADPAWIPLAADISTVIDTIGELPQAEHHEFFALTEQLDTTLPSIGATCLDEFEIELTTGAGERLADLAPGEFIGGNAESAVSSTGYQQVWIDVLEEMSKMYQDSADATGTASHTVIAETMQELIGRKNELISALETQQVPQDWEQAHRLLVEAVELARSASQSFLLGASSTGGSTDPIYDGISKLEDSFKVLGEAIDTAGTCCLDASDFASLDLPDAPSSTL